MSFGFSLGDFIAAIELAHKIRKEFVDAPRQFIAISDEVRSLSIVLRDVEIALSEPDHDTQQRDELRHIANGCQNVLSMLDETLDKYRELNLNPESVDKKMKKVWKRLKWEPEDIRDLRRRVSSNVTLLNAFNGRLTRDNGIKLVRFQDHQERRSILEWLSPVNYATQQCDYISRRRAGTGQWMLDSAEFQVWIETEKQTLFCPGIPGAGKTILTSIVVEELNKRFQNDGSVGIAYLYYNFRLQHEQKLEDSFASLLKQFAQEHSILPDGVKSLYDRHKDKGTRPSFDEILRALHSVTATYSRTFLVVDALDECSVAEGCRTRSILQFICLQTSCRASLFATSRFIPEITEKFKDNVSLEIRASNADVRTYLDDRMSQLPAFVRRNPELQEEIKTEIVKAVDGMFLLAQLHLDSLIGKRAPKAVRSALRKLPTGSGAYDHAYLDAMERIDGQSTDSKDLAKHILSWLTLSKRPLTTIEIQYALAIEIGECDIDKENIPDVEDIISVCAGLVTVDEESKVIRLVHYTTQEYFERTQKSWFPAAETEIAETCVTCCLFSVFESGYCLTDEEFEIRLRENALYDYAAGNWGYHARAALIVAKQPIICLLESEAKLSACTQAMFSSKRSPSHLNYSQEFPRHMAGVHVAAWFGLEGALHVLLKRGHHPDLKDSYGQTPLMWAASNGNEAVVKQLLEELAEIDAKNETGETALIQSIVRDREAMVQLLLEAGANFLTEGSFGRRALHYAAEISSEGIIRLLLDREHVIDARDNHGCTALHWAAATGHISITQTLLEAGADIEARDNVGRTPLQCVSTESDVIRLLLEKGADMRTTSNSGDSILHMAASNGDEVVMNLLLDKDVSTEIKNKKGQVPLHRASRNGNEHIVRLLIEKGAKLTTQDDKGKTALHVAAWHGHANIVRLLLDKGADVQVRDISGKTILQYAASNGQEMIIIILFDSGADLNAQDHAGLTALHKAAVGGHATVVKLLLGLGALTEIKDDTGQTALNLAHIKRPWHLAEIQQVIFELLG